MIRVRVPATSANIGPGFDAMGLALKLYNEFSFESLEKGIEIVGFQEKYKNDDNLVLKSVRRLYEKAGKNLKGIRITVKEGIPVSRGLGSSAACIVGGLVGANALLDKPLTKDELISLAVEIEGHPDNVVPAFEGGLTVSYSKDGSVRHEKINFDYEKLLLYALIPDFEVSTEKARKALPETFTLEDVVCNISRTAMLVALLVNGKFENLWDIFGDRVHQPYRSRLINGFDSMEEKMRELEFDGLFISGAGPTLMGVLSERDSRKVEALKEFLDSMENKWKLEPVGIDKEGVQIL